MNLEKIPVGRNPPWDVNALIEIPLGGAPVKADVDLDPTVATVGVVFRF